jgi:BetI-type transcriptional repressor, C-terminal
VRVERNTKRRSVRRPPATSKRKTRRSRPAPPAPPPPTLILEERALPIVSALDRVAKGPSPARLKLEGAMEILFGAYGESDFEFSGLFLTGWMRAREDKQFRLTVAWQREQARLSLQDILVEGVASGDFRRDLDPGATAAVILGTAEGCLLQSATDGGAVTAEQLMRTLLALIVSGA